MFDAVMQWQKVLRGRLVAGLRTEQVRVGQGSPEGWALEDKISALLRKGGPIKLEEVAGLRSILEDRGAVRWFFRSLMEGVAAMHSLGIFNYDLKIENIMVADGPTLKIMVRTPVGHVLHHCVNTCPALCSPQCRPPGRTSV